ncbi:hypothetical protein A6A27_13385 [Micromonospora sp. CB01531]|nr:hypothetical protein A6A27_13385 [Micromonospora sp. CB01531]
MSRPACGSGLSSDRDARSEQLPCLLGDFGDEDLGVSRVGDDPDLKKWHGAGVGHRLSFL